MKNFERLTVFVVLLILGCTNDDSTLPIVSACEVENPIGDLAWLKLEVQKRKNDTSPDAIYCYIEQGIIDGKTIFIYNDCNPLIDKVIPIQDCSGISIGLLGDKNHNPANIEDRTIIYKPSNFTCQLE